MLQRAITFALTAAIAAAGVCAIGSSASAAPDARTYTTWNTVNPGHGTRFYQTAWQNPNGRWRRRDRDDRWTNNGRHNGWRDRDRNHPRRERRSVMR